MKVNAGEISGESLFVDVDYGGACTFLKDGRGEWENPLKDRLLTKCCFILVSTRNILENCIFFPSLIFFFFPRTFRYDIF